MATPSTPTHRNLVAYESRGERMTVSNTYRLLQSFYPKDPSEKYFLKDAPDIIPLTSTTTIRNDTSLATSTPASTSKSLSKNRIPFLSWTPYKEIIKDSPRTYLLGMILLVGEPTGYALSLNVVEKRKNRRLVLKFVGKHIGGFRWILAFDVLGKYGPQFEAGGKQGERANVVFDQTVGELIVRFEGIENGFSGTNKLLGAYVEKGIKQLEAQWG